tara:strand:+ start:51 stop:398 length:348 start_codon:yes stop_codon:yes gene_type:complete
MVKMKVFLVASDGDCAAGGLSNTNDAILIEKKHYEMIKSFMKAQNDYLTESAMMERWEECTGPAFREICERYWNVMERMTEAGIFKHKYHARTFWELVRENDLEHHDPIEEVHDV